MRATHEDRPPYEVITMGRMGVDLYPLETNVALEDVDRFGRFLGGTAANVAVAAARHGRKTAVISRTGDDPFGRFLHRELRRLGVDDAFVTSVPALPTPITFCEMRPPDHFPLWFYRWPKAPDMEIRPEEIDPQAVAAAGVFWAALSGLSDEPSRSAHFQAWEARGRRQFTVLDLDYRPMFWPSREDAGESARQALSQVSVAVGNVDEVYTAVGERDPARAARALLGLGVELAVVKRGPEGVLAMTTDGEVEVPPQSVAVVNGLGAGDGFGGALCHGLLSGWDLERTLRFANAAGAIVASRVECSTAMPVTAEVEAVLATSGQEPAGSVRGPE